MAQSQRTEELLSRGEPDAALSRAALQKVSRLGDLGATGVPLARVSRGSAVGCSVPQRLSERVGTICSGGLDAEPWGSAARHGNGRRGAVRRCAEGRRDRAGSPSCRVARCLRRHASQRLTTANDTEVKGSGTRGIFGRTWPTATLCAAKAHDAPVDICRWTVPFPSLTDAASGATAAFVHSPCGGAME
jgi:hypothetical protein